jgi:hypothetical protein
MSSLKLNGSTSGYVEIVPPAVAGNNSVTLPSGSGTLVTGDSGGNLNVSGIITATSFVIGAGSTASPSLSPTGDSNTGIFFPAADTIAFGEGGAEAMRIDSNGVVNIGTSGSTLAPSTTSYGITLYPNNYSVMSAAGNEPLTLNRGNDGFIMSIRRGGTGVGSIQVTTSSTSFNTSSDYRLKENVVPLIGAVDRLNQLQVHRFNFIVDPDTTVDGFIAHEVQAVVPECVTGTKDEVEVWKEGEELPDGVSVGDAKLDEDGNTIPVYQGIDQSKLVPLLTAALQETIAELNALKAEVAALKNS